jgi:Asp-tRNA(Asn)/Glu-tRNA(Gln) amidotransferase B subunit
MLLTDDFHKRWEEIIDQVDKDHIPMHCVKKVIFRTTSRKQKTINIKNLRSKGLNNDIIESMVDTYIKENEHDITSMEFVLDVEAVATVLQPETDKLLKGM